MDLTRGVDVAVTAVMKDFERRSKRAQSSEDTAHAGNPLFEWCLWIGGRSPMR
jgi:hypothetical protein